MFQCLSTETTSIRSQFTGVVSVKREIFGEVQKLPATLPQPCMEILIEILFLPFMVSYSKSQRWSLLSCLLRKDTLNPTTLYKNSVIFFLESKVVSDHHYYLF